MRVNNGVLDDGLEIDRTSRQWGEFTRWHKPSFIERMREEAAWARRSGPVRVIRPANNMRGSN
jgi:hypothetical protein